MPITNIQLIKTGIVSNLLKTPYYLRVPQELTRKDRIGKTVVIPPAQAIELDYRDWVLVEDELIIRDRLNVLRIIRYPEANMQAGQLIVINNYFELPPTPEDGSVVWVQYGDYQGLYYYDTVRNEWLSENESQVLWLSSTDSNANNITLINNSNDTHQDNDVENITPITIVSMAASQANEVAVGNGTRFSINSYVPATGLRTLNVAHIDLTSGRGVNDTSLNFPIDGDNVLAACRIKLSGTDNVVRPALTIWYRKRLVP